MVTLQRTTITIWYFPYYRFWGHLVSRHLDISFYQKKQQIKTTLLQKSLKRKLFISLVENSARDKMRNLVKIGVAAWTVITLTKKKKNPALSEEVKFADVLFVKISWLYWELPLHYPVFNIFGVRMYQPMVTF